MLLLKLLFSNLVFPAIVFCLSQEEANNILDIADKQILLNKEFQNFWKIFKSDSPPDWLDSTDGEIPLTPIRKKRLVLAALHERFAAIQLNVACWLCAWYYEQNPFAESPGDKSNAYSRKCEKMAILLSWFNEKFSAKMFIEAFLKSFPQPKESSSVGQFLDRMFGIEIIEEPIITEEEAAEMEKEECQNQHPAEPDTRNRFERLIDACFGIEIETEPIVYEKQMNLLQLAQKIETVLKKLKIMNVIFQDAKMQYNGISQKLEDKSNLDGIENSDFHKKTSKLLWRFLGLETLEIANYMFSFYGTQYKVLNYDQLIVPWDIAKLHYEQICLQTESEMKYSSVDTILILENQRISAEILTKDLQVPQNFGLRLWSIQEKHYGKSDFKFVYVS